MEHARDVSILESRRQVRDATDISTDECDSLWKVLGWFDDIKQNHMDSFLVQSAAKAEVRKFRVRSGDPSAESKESVGNDLPTK